MFDPLTVAAFVGAVVFGVIACVAIVLADLPALFVEPEDRSAAFRRLERRGQ